MTTAPPADTTAVSGARVPTIVRLKNVVLFGHHGVSNAEREAGTRIEVDVEMRVRVDPRDALSSTVDYSAVFRTVESVVTGRQFQLLESLGTAIRAAVLEAYPAEQVAVRVRKPNLPFPGGDSYAEIEVGACHL